MNSPPPFLKRGKSVQAKRSKKLLKKLKNGPVTYDKFMKKLEK